MECVEIMDRISRRIEQGKTVGEYVSPVKPYSARTHLNSTAVYLANNIQAAGICVFSHSGKTARYIAGLRPQTAPVYAFTPNLDVCRSLSLHFGIRSHVIEFHNDPNENLLRMQSRLLERGYMHPGDSIVVVSDLVVEKEILHAIHVHTLKSVE
jgi:pyruvate kinase